MRIVFMGSPEFALPSLGILLEHQYDVPLVVTVPDKPAGRGRHVASSPVKDFADRRKIETLQPESLTDPAFLQRLKSLSPDLFVVVAFRILPKACYEIPSRGAFNLHASLLPKFRGAAPINWAIINGERETGVTTFFLQDRVDTGSVILQARTTIGPDETAGDLHDRLADIGAEIVLQTVHLIEVGKAKPWRQDDSLASRAPKIFKEGCRVDWNKTAREVHDFIRGLSPRPCAFSLLDESSFRFYRSRVASSGNGGSPGSICATTTQLLVQTGSGAIEILEIQQEGKKRMSSEEFLRGYRFPSTSVFH